MVAMMKPFMTANIVAVACTARSPLWLNFIRCRQTQLCQQDCLVLFDMACRAEQSAAALLRSIHNHKQAQQQQQDQNAEQMCARLYWSLLKQKIHVQACYVSVEPVLRQCRASVTPV